MQSEGDLDKKKKRKERTNGEAAIKTQKDTEMNHGRNRLGTKAA